jgi:hypothetical protein
MIRRVELLVETWRPIWEPGVTQWQPIIKDADTGTRQELTYPEFTTSEAARIRGEAILQRFGFTFDEVTNLWTREVPDDAE